MSIIVIGTWAMINLPFYKGCLGKIVNYHEYVYHKMIEYEVVGVCRGVTFDVTVDSKYIIKGPPGEEK